MIFLELFITFFKIGLFTFGGGYAMLPLIEEEVINHGWLTMEELVNFIAVSESTPGPFAVNISTYIGTVTGGFFGAVCATSGVVLPSFIIILIIARAYKAFQNNKYVQGVLTGLRPNVVGLIASALIGIIISSLFPNGLNSVLTFNFGLSILIIALVIFLYIKKKIQPVILILISAVIGIAGGIISELL